MSDEDSADVTAHVDEAEGEGGGALREVVDVVGGDIFILDWSCAVFIGIWRGEYGYDVVLGGVWDVVYGKGDPLFVGGEFCGVGSEHWSIVLVMSA